MSESLSFDPCLSCGACCQYYRVSFHWSETLPESYAVPRQFTESVSPHHLAMRGTNCASPRCIALEGTVGSKVSCSIYQQRSSTCRELNPSFQTGIANEKCDEARRGYGLQPLELNQWLATKTVLF